MTLKMRVFKKGLTGRPQTPREKRQFTTAHKELIESIGRRCELMNIPRCTFYYRCKEKSLDELKLEVDVKDEMERICLEFPRYGYRRVTKQLQREGWTVNHKRVLRMMRENDLICRVRRRNVRTTNSDYSYPVFPNLIKDLFTTSVNEVWVSDITYIRITTAFVYLAVILDLYSREVKRISSITAY